MDLVFNNVDLLMEILLRLPVKSLIRFKSVCKNWHALISSDRFCHQHTLRRPKLQESLILEIRTTLQHFYFNPTTGGEKKMIPYSLSDPDLRILHACNGLLLLESTRSPCSQYTYCDPRHPEKTFDVYNPATRRSRTIKLTKSNDYPYVADINLAFDPSESPHYKIVCLKSAAVSSICLASYTFQIEVYDSESRTWKLRLEGIKCLRMHLGEYWNHAICWRSYKGYFNFDIANNKTKTIHFPETPCEEEKCKFCTPYLQELNGHLYHFDLVEEIECESVALSELGGEEESKWLLKYYHRLTLTVGDDYAIGVRLVGSDGDGVCSLLTYLGGKIWAYNFLDKSYKDVLDLTGQPFYQRDWSFIFKAFQFGETLALV